MCVCAGLCMSVSVETEIENVCVHLCVREREGMCV